MLLEIFISFIIYSIFFCLTGNTCYRINADGIKQIHITPLFIDGIFGHLKSLYLALRYMSLTTFFIYLYNLIFSLNNIFGALIFVFYISTIIKFNFLPIA
jgi:hypothetical protein